MGNAAPDLSGQALARLRIAAGLSARQLAEKAGVSHTAVCQAERGRPVRQRVLAALESVLGPEVRQAVWPPTPGMSRVTAARRASGLDSTQAAKRAGVGRHVLKRAEDGLGVHPANAKKIADALGLDVADVLPIEEDTPNQRAA